MTTATTFNVGILVVSTTAAKDPSTDSSTQLLRDFFQAENDAHAGKHSWVVAETKIVSDDQRAVETAVLEWAEKKLHLIVTTGGTGFAVTDVTPEVCSTQLQLSWSYANREQAVKPLLEKEAPGLVYVHFYDFIKLRLIVIDTP
jgi:gephyrin